MRQQQARVLLLAAVAAAAAVVTQQPAAVQAQQQPASAAEVLAACGVALPAWGTALANASAAALPGFPRAVAWSAGSSAALPRAALGELVTLRYVRWGGTAAAAPCSVRTVARAYHGGAWEGVRPDPVHPTCVPGAGGDDCTFDAASPPPTFDGFQTAAGTVGAYVLEGVTRATGALSNAEAAARFLSTATFGPTEADVASLLALGSLTDTDPADDSVLTHFATWIGQQQALPPTFLRAHLRERVFARMRGGDEFVQGRLSKPCDIGSRWHRHAFIPYDAAEELTVDRVTGGPQCYYRLTMNGIPMTDVVDTFAGENCTDTGTPARRTMVICDVDEFDDAEGFVVASQASDCSSSSLSLPMPIPQIEFIGAIDGTTTQEYQPGEVALQPVERVSGAVYIAARSGLCSDLSRRRVSFIGVPDASAGNATVYYRLDARRTLVDNPLTSPASLTEPGYEAACPNVDSNIVNEGACQLQYGTSVCSSTVYQDGTSVQLVPASFQQWYDDTNQYVFSVSGLRPEASVTAAPCEQSQTSRWIRTAGACPGGAPGTLPAATETLVLQALADRAAFDPNPDVRDIVVSDFGSCDDSASTIGAEVFDGSSCWRQSHPNERDVYDFSQWYTDHPGGPAFIAQFALTGTFELEYPASHSMARWWDNFQIQRNGVHHRLGKLGDAVEFSELPKTLQTPQMAAYVGATASATAEGFLSCSSRAEVASNPERGHLYLGDHRDRSQGLDWPHRTFNMGSTYVWDTVALTSGDQLRHRVAWALGQIVVARGDDFLDSNPEPMTAFYDIFVEHAFGNYRDILREVSASPIMGRYLTFHGNRAFSSSGTFPDENYAREIMQLFSIGIFQLDEFGIEKRDPVTDQVILTYTNTDIENGARVWTGWLNRPQRRNLIRMTRTQPNYVDPMQLRPDYRDRFPKTRLANGDGSGGFYLGDAYPPCADLPPQHFLKPGAKYVLTGTNSRLGVFYDEIAGLNNSIARDHFMPEPSSDLFAALCDAPGPASDCTFPSTVVLSAPLTCSGAAECGADTLHVLKIESPGGSVGYYQYQEPPCTYMSFFEGGRIAANSNGEQCADASVALITGVTCCDASDLSQVLTSLNSSECGYLAEPMTYETAQARCAAEHTNGVVCPASSWVFSDRLPLREGYQPVTNPTVPAGTVLVSDGATTVSGTYNGAPRWRIPVEDTMESRSGLNGPVVLTGALPGNAGSMEYTFSHLQYFALNGDSMYVVPHASMGLYMSAGGDQQLVDFNAMFPVGTTFTVARVEPGPDPTGELGTHPRWEQFCAAWQYTWTPDACGLEAEIDAIGRVTMVDARAQSSSSRPRHLREGSGNKFYVDWGTPAAAAGTETFPTVDNSGSDPVCPTNGCRANSAGDACVCDATVVERAVFTDASANVPTPAALRAALHVGAFAPESYGPGVYTQCTTGPCTAQGADVEVWTRGASASPAAFDADTIFVLGDRPGLRAAPRYLRNRESTVQVGTAPDSYVQLPITDCDSSSFYNTSGQLQQNGDPRFWCHNVYNGNPSIDWATQGEGAGSFIWLDFGAPRNVSEMRYANRCGSRTNAELLLTFSDMSTQTVTLNNNTLCLLETFMLNTVETSFVNITVLSAYSEWDNGARTIEFYGRAGEGLADPAAFNFRNAPYFNPNAGAWPRNPPDNSPRYELYGWEAWEYKAQAETEALIDTLLEHENTPVMIAMQLIQKLVTSNPSPRYVKAVADAFRTGSYGSQLTFSGEYGDLGATVAAVLLDREARDTTLDLDPNHGKLQEPLLKVFHLMRSMEYQKKPGVEVMLQELAPRIGQGAFQYPSVFSFFSPFYVPPGEVADAGLVAPESEILTAPLLISFLNGMDSLVEYGLTSCRSGFGDRSDFGPFKRNYCRSSTIYDTSDGTLEYSPGPSFDDVEYPATGPCTASASPANGDTSSSCENLFDGTGQEWRGDNNDLVGAWARLEFGAAETFDTLRFKNDCSGRTNAQVLLHFSDGTNVTVTDIPDNCTELDYPLGRTITADTVIVEIAAVHNSSTQSYVRVEELGFLLSGGALATIRACTASSERSFSRSNSCNPSLGNESPLPGFVWQGEGVGAWVEQDLGSSRTIGRVRFADTCSQLRPREVRLEFSGGAPAQTIELENDCDPMPMPINPVTTTLVRATVVTTYNATESDCCDCERLVRRVADPTATSVACEMLEEPSTDLPEIRVWSPRDAAGVVDKLGGLLSPGRLPGPARSIIGDAYLYERDQAEALKRAMKLFILTPSFNVNTDPAPLLSDRPATQLAPSRGRPYKAVITILLAGGADSYNMLIPDRCTNNLYGEYSTIRGPDNTIPRGQLHEVPTGSFSAPQPCETFGFHPSLSYFKQAYDDDECLLFANTGAMAEPINSVTEYRSRTKQQPVGNFGHNGMQRNVQSLDATDHLAKGVLGRMVGSVSSAPSSFNAAMYSTASHKKILEGSLTPNIIQAGSGVIRYSGLAEVQDALTALNRRQHNSIFGETYSRSLSDSITSTESLGELLSATTLATNESAFNDAGSLGRQLLEVAKLIRVDNRDLGTERAGYIVQQGGYDTHGTFDLVPLLSSLDLAVKLFADEMKAQGVWDDVAVVITSDFARTLTSNGQGTDHAWGGNYAMFGGNVKGGRILGSFPESLAAGHTLDLGRGRLLPTTPWEAIWHGISEWFSVPTDDMTTVLPNMGNFPFEMMFREEDLFGTTPAEPAPPPESEKEEGLGAGAIAGIIIAAILGVLCLGAIIAGAIAVKMGRLSLDALPFGGSGSELEIGDVELE